MTIGDKLYAIIRRKSKTDLGTYFGLINAFQQEHPDSFYTGKAESEIAPVRAALRKVLDTIRAHEQRGDMYSKFKTIREATAQYAKIPEFKEANRRWIEEAKDPKVRRSIAEGKAYSEIFEDVAKLNARLASSRAKNKKITGKKRRAKAEEKALANYRRKLKLIAGRLEKLAAKDPDSYHGRAASKSLELYAESQGQSLTDQRGR
jgi:hypothetical protein